jgi:peptidoglycan hydrolase CwlO-like protein
MIASRIIAGIIIYLLIGYFFLKIVYPDLFKRKRKPVSSLDELEKESEEIVEKKQKIRGETEKTQSKINNINKNLKK